MFASAVQRIRAVFRRRLERRSVDPLQQYLLVVDWLNTVLKPVGCDIFTAGFSSTNPLACNTMVNIGLFFCLNVYNLWRTRAVLIDFMFCFATMLYVVMMSAKMEVFVHRNNQIRELHGFNRRFYDRFKRGDQAQRDLLTDYTTDTCLLVTVFAISSSPMLLFVFILALLWSALVEFTLPFAYVLPGIGYDYLLGFAINMAYQLLECTLTTIGIVASEGIFFTLVLNACLHLDMLRLDLSRLAALCQTDDGDGEDRTREIRDRIRTIIEHHNAQRDYTNKLCGLFELHFFIIFGCISCQLISIVVVVVLVPDWFPGYFLFFMLTGQIFFSCTLGEILDLKCDALRVAIYNVPWYRMEARDQKAMQLLLLASQWPTLISYRFGTVNIRAFFKILA
ncbi:putative odorant receptor 83c [Anopheles bellator]|uniref:putative odorant receptor 83c n=1 Tax=Anopheles bellator TaxID=139047 RepID=UPI00264757B2|nr:putative odorant receptor 83c [Anopheles bellator]